MGLTQECKDLMLEYGLLSKDDRPAAAELLGADVMRIALVGGDLDKEFPEGFSEYMTGLISNEKHHLALDSAYPLPMLMRQNVADVIGKYYNGHIQFVDYDQMPDLIVFGYDVDPSAAVPHSHDGHAHDHEGDERYGALGFASLPDWDGRRSSAPEVPFMGLNVGALDQQSELFNHMMETSGIARLSLLNNGTQNTLEHIIEHEWLHNLGAVHAIDALKGMVSTDRFNTECSHEDVIIITATDPMVGGILNESVASSMAERPPENSYDRVLKEHLVSTFPGPGAKP